mmetsp:Transcript_12463/g.30234  ORF Transcript_12463/g.30234 Transcript_12463/m.30234 type:complete len:204 (+) Transcript_12463:254-865(+)
MHGFESVLLSTSTRNHTMTSPFLFSTRRATPFSFPSHLAWALIPAPCCFRMASVTTFTPISTSGTPLPGRVLAPTKCSPSTSGESSAGMPVRTGGRNAASCVRPCDSPKTAPCLMLNFSFQSVGVVMLSCVMCAVKSPWPASLNRLKMASRPAFTMSSSDGTGTPRFLHALACSLRFPTGSRTITELPPAGAHVLSVNTGLWQ